MAAPHPFCIVMATVNLAVLAVALFLHWHGDQLCSSVVAIPLFLYCHGNCQPCCASSCTMFALPWQPAIFNGGTALFLYCHGNQPLQLCY